MADIITVPIGLFGTDRPVRWDTFCRACQAGRSFDSETDLGIWVSAHEDSCRDQPIPGPLHLELLEVLDRFAEALAKATADTATMLAEDRYRRKHPWRWRLRRLKTRVRRERG